MFVVIATLGAIPSYINKGAALKRVQRFPNLYPWRALPLSPRLRSWLYRSLRNYTTTIFCGRSRLYLPSGGAQLEDLLNRKILLCPRRLQRNYQRSKFGVLNLDYPKKQKDKTSSELAVDIHNGGRGMGCGC